MASWGYGLSFSDVQTIIKHYLDSTGIKSYFKDNKPGGTWFNLFKKRHPILSERIPQNFPRNRAESLSKESLKSFFEMVKNKYDQLNMINKPTHIFNCDETGFSGDRGKEKIICRTSTFFILFKM